MQKARTVNVVEMKLVEIGDSVPVAVAEVDGEGTGAGVGEGMTGAAIVNLGELNMTMFND